MFGLEHVTQATDWVKAQNPPGVYGRRIVISFNGDYVVQFMDGGFHSPEAPWADTWRQVADGRGPDLMMALKAALALVDPKL